MPLFYGIRSWATPTRHKKTHASAEPPRLQIDEVLTPGMGLNGLNNFLLDSASSPPRPNGIPSDGQQDQTRIIPTDHETPSKATTSGSRRHFSQQHSEPAATSSPSQHPSALCTPSSDVQDPAWSSAVGRATLGKTGRVVERLMAENDSLRREKNLMNLKLEEEIRRGDSARFAMEGLRSTNENLTSMKEMDKTLLAKRERRIEEMKLELEAERQRRQRAEAETKATRGERDETVEGLKREFLIEKEQARRATTQYDVISRSYKGLDENYGRQIRKLKTDLKSFQEEVAADKRKLASIQTIMEHFKNEKQRAQEAKDQLTRAFDAYKAEAEQGMRSIREAAERNAEANDQTRRELQAVLGQMRYVINIKKNVETLES